MSNTPWTNEEFQQRLRALGDRYHVHHPFHVAMHEGKLSRHQIQGWIINRFYYQLNIPRKDASILANSPDQEFRRIWRKRIIEHDGLGNDDGGIDAWLRLGEACGITRSDILSLNYVLPAVRFAVDAYVNFARVAPWQEAVCASLTELFAPHIHQIRLETFPKAYPWIEKGGLEYFQRRLKEAPQDVRHGLAVTLDYFQSRDAQERALSILQFKLNVLWSMLDALYLAYVAKLPSSNPETILVER